MNISEANAIARLLRGIEQQTDREYLAHRAADTLKVSVQPGRVRIFHVTQVSSDGFRMTPECSCGWQGSPRWFKGPDAVNMTISAYDLATQDAREHSTTANAHAANLATMHAVRETEVPR